MFKRPNTSNNDVKFKMLGKICSQDSLYEILSNRWWHGIALANVLLGKVKRSRVFSAIITYCSSQAHIIYFWFSTNFFLNFLRRTVLRLFIALIWSLVLLFYLSYYQRTICQSFCSRSASPVISMQSLNKATQLAILNQT